MADTFTLGTAAKRLGLSKPTVSKHIKEGRLAAVKLDDGSYQIDAAELARFEASYKKRKVGRPPGPTPGTRAIREGGDDLAKLELAMLRERLEEQKAAADKRVAELEADRDQARRDLNDAREQLARITETVIVSGRSPWWQKLLGKG